MESTMQSAIMSKKWSVAALYAALCLSVPVIAQDTAAPIYSKVAPVVTIPYSRHVDFDHIRNLLGVRLSINGGEPHNFTLDTGSVGIMVAATDIPNFDGKGEPASLTYSSSGVHLEGVRIMVDVTFADAKSPDGKPVVAHMPVMAVTKRTCLGGKAVNAAHCDESAPIGTHMMGVGFGRSFDAAENQTRNPFVMLNAMQDGSMRRGYMLTRKGVQLGLSAESVGSGFVFQKLDVRPASAAPDFKGPRDYVTAPGTFVVNGKAMPMGTILMDTGLTNMMLAVAGGPQEGEVPNGTKIGIALLGGRLKYEVTVGDPAGKAVPRKVNWVNASHGTYVNTGLRALELYDYLYDAEAGFLALRPTSK